MEDTDIIGRFCTPEDFSTKELKQAYRKRFNDWADFSWKSYDRKPFSLKMWIDGKQINTEQLKEETNMTTLEFVPGKKYVDREGNVYRFVGFNVEETILRSAVFANCDSAGLATRSRLGKSPHGYTLHDIIAEYKPRETQKFYVNVYEDSAFMGGAYKNRKDADYWADQMRQECGERRIECLEITTGEDVLTVRRV